jgi:hypothetical protein
VESCRAGVGAPPHTCAEVVSQRPASATAAGGACADGRFGRSANVSEALSTEEDGTWAGVGVPLRLEVIDQDLPHRPTHPAILAAARASAGEYGAGDTMEEAAASEAEGEGGQREEGDANGGGKGEVEGWLWLEGRFSTAEDRIVAGILVRLEHPDLAVRRASLRAISAFVGAGNARAVRGVLRRLEHPEAAVRASAVEAVTLVAPLGDLSAVDGCLALCHDARADVRASALEALARVAPLSLPAFLPTCASLIDDPAPQGPDPAFVCLCLCLLPAHPTRLLISRVGLGFARLQSDTWPRKSSKRQQGDTSVARRRPQMRS